MDHIANRIVRIKIASAKQWRNAFRKQTPDMLPMTATVVRESKHLYCCRLSFYPSKRKYDDVFIRATSKRDAVKQVKARFPNVRRVK